MSSPYTVAQYKRIENRWKKQLSIGRKAYHVWREEVREKPMFKKDFERLILKNIDRLELVFDSWLRPEHLNLQGTTRSAEGQREDLILEFINGYLCNYDEIK